jgi:hypothetical protein
MDIPNECDLLWWFGVLQTDCYIHKKDGEIRELRLLVGRKSLPMLIKWKEVLDKMTGKIHRVEIWKSYDKRYKKVWTGFVVRDVSRERILALIQRLPYIGLGDDFVKWISTKPLGPYLAGIIDGDGHIQIRKRYFDRGHEKLLKITDSKPDRLVLIQLLLSNAGMPKGYITEYENHSDLWGFVPLASKSCSRVGL